MLVDPTPGVRQSEMAVCTSRWCSMPSVPTSQLSFGRPSPSTVCTSFPSKKLASVLHVPAGSRWRREPLPGTLHRCCGGACFGSWATGGGPSPCIRNRIFIKGLPNSISEGTLAKTFAEFGAVTRVKIITSKISRQSLGFAYIWFASEEDAQLAVEEMDGKFVGGRFIYVTIARPESPTTQVRATPYQFQPK